MAQLTDDGYTLFPTGITHADEVNSAGGGYNLSGGIVKTGDTTLTGGGYTQRGGLWPIIGEPLNDNSLPSVGEPVSEPTSEPVDCPAPPAAAPPLRPLVSFPRPQADGQYRIILWNWDYHLAMFDVIRSLSDICATTTCTIPPDAQLLPFGLVNGGHSIYVQQQPDGNWIEAETFAINHPPPALVSNISVDLDQGHPILTWIADSNALYFQVVLVSSAGEIAYMNWHGLAPELCCGNICTLKPEAYLPDGSYAAYVQAWGPGGFSPGGLANLGWAGSSNFDLSTSPPPIVSDLSTTNEYTGNPVFGWTGSPGVTWYQIWVGTVNPLNTELVDWYQAEVLGCENAGPCALTTMNLNLSSGMYDWYVRGWGPGGFTTGGIEGWVQGNKVAVEVSPPIVEAVIPTFSSATLTWAGVEGVTYYQIWVGTPEFATLHLDWHSAVDLGCKTVGETCELDLSALNLAPGEYLWTGQLYRSDDSVSEWSAPVSFTIE